MKKQIIRFFSLFMLVVLLVTAFSMQVSARVVFSDLAPTHWCYNKIIDFEKKGYVCGYQDGTFRADRTITRAEYVKIVNNFFGYKPNTENVAKFSDVSSDDWFAPYVNEAVARGYITGFEDGTFKPQDPIRRQEATVILARILGIDKEVYPADHVDGLAQYSDSEDVQEWARVAIHSYSVYNFINGYTDGTLKILQNVTRAETVELLHILEQKVIIDREPSGGKPTAKMPTIALWKQRIGETETGDKLVVSSAATPTKSGWINKSESTSRNGEDGVLVNITSTTAKSTINETLTGNKSNSRQYPTTATEDLTEALFLTDGEYKVLAFTSRTGYKSSKSAEKTILVDTKAPTIDGEVVTELPDGTIVAHEQKIKVTVKDPQATGVNKISGLDTEKVRYAWFMYIGDGIYERATDWANVILDSDGNAVISTEGLGYGSYKLGISAYDIAENPYGERIDKVSTISGDEELTEEIPYDFVEEVTKEGEEKPEDPDIIVIVGNNTPTVENLVMKTKVNETVSGKIKAEDKDGDTLTYTLIESGDYAKATISGDETSFKHENVGTYQYNVEVSDGEESAIALVTVYVYDVNVVIPSGDSGDPSENPEYDVTADGVIIYVGEEKELTAKVSPTEADNKEYAWAENAEEIDFVGETNSDKATIKGLVPGKTTVTVKVTVDGVEIEKDIDVIVKSRITVTLPSYEKEYDGTKLVASNEFKQEDLKIDGTVKAGDVILVADVAGEALNVEDKAEVTKSGDFKVIDQNGNDRTEFYEPTFENGKLTIKAKSDEVVVTITEHSGDAKYDGTEHSVSGYDVAISNTLYTESDFTFNGTAEVKGTNAGTYNMELKASDFQNTNTNFANVKFVIVDGTLEIAKREVELISASDSKEYDGTALTNDTVTVSGDGFVNGEGATYDVTGSQTGVGNSDNGFTYTLNEGTDADNYIITKTEGKLEVTAATSEVIVTITEHSGEAKYDGTEHSVSGYDVAISNTLYTENDFTFSGTAEVKGTNAGSYDMELKDSDFKNTNSNFANVRFVIVDGTLEIAKRKVELISASDNKEYDGTALTNSNVTVSGDGFATGEGATYDVSGSRTDVGESDNEFSYTLNDGTDADNYIITKTEGKLEVTPTTSEVVVIIKGNNAEVKYDGQTHEATGYTVKSISDSKYTSRDFTFKGNATVSGKDFGTYQMNLKESDFENTNKNFSNVKFVVEDGALEITKRNVTLISATAEKVYDGAALTNDTITVSGDGFVDGEGATYTVTGNQTDVGESDNEFSYTLKSNTNADNYNITVEKGKLTVTADANEVVVTIKGNSAEVKYDGQIHEVTGYTVESISDNKYTSRDFTFKGNATVSGKDFGTYQMNLKESDFENTNKNFSNVKFVVEDGALEITKRNVTLISATAEKVYDGTALTNDTVTVSGDGFVDGEGATYKVTGSQTDAGESDNEFSYTLKSNTNADNYNITVEEGNLKVTPVTDEVTVTIKGNTEKVKYNGKKQEVTGYQVEISNPLYKESDFEFSGDARVEAVDADTYYMGMTVADFKNVSKNFTNIRLIVIDGSLVIEKRKVTLTSASDEKEYDGTALTKNKVVVTEDGFVTGEGATYDVTGSQIEVGESDNKFTYTLNANTKASNYEITKEEGKLKVTAVKTEILVKIKENGETLKYDGENHEVTGYTVESISNSKYTVDDFKFNGNATVTGKDAGTYEMELKASDFENINKNFAKVRFEITDGSLVIEKRKVTLTSASDEKYYNNGFPLTNHNVTVTGDGFVDGEGATYEFTGSQSEIGESENKFTYKLNANTKEDNYEIKVEYGKLKVKEYVPDVKITGLTANYPDANGRQAEPGEKVSYTLTVKNNESNDTRVKVKLASDGEVYKYYKIVYKDKDGNVTREETVTDSKELELTILENGTVDIIFEAKVDNNYRVNSEFETTATVSTTNGTKLDEETKTIEVQKSSTIVANNKKNKNIILIVDLSGSMDDNGKIAALRSAATTFTNKLKEDADTTGSDITLTLIGIGAGQGSDGTVTKYMYYKNRLDKDVAYDDTYAYKMGFYTKDDWSKISEFINKNHEEGFLFVRTVYDNFYADGGTNITGALEIAHEIIETNNKYGARLLTDNAETFTVLLTDGANGPKGDIRISPTNVDATYVRENSTLFAIGFGDGAQEGTDGYNDLLAVTEDDDLIYSAASASDLNEAFESIANKIGQEQSVAGKIEIELPEDGKYFPIIVTHKVGGEETELFKVNTYVELASRKMSVNTTTNKLVWDLSGTDYSACEELKIKLTLDATATDGGANQLLIDDIMNEVKDISIDIIENEKNPSGDVTENSGDEVKNTEEVISSGDNKNVDKAESGDDTKVIDSANNVEAKADENVSGDADKNRSIADEKTSDANENESKVDEKVSEDANKNNVEADKNTENNEVSNGTSNNENEEPKNNEIIDENGKQNEEVVKEEIENDEKNEADNNEEQNKDEKEIVENKNDQQAIIPEKTTLKDEEENEAA